MKLADFDYRLPESFIAQEPIEPRDRSRLMVLNRHRQTIEHRVFQDIGEYLRPGDVLVLNTTRVIPARLHSKKARTGGGVELLLLRQIDDVRWLALAGGRGTRPGLALYFENTDVEARIEDVLAGSERIVRFSRPVNDLLEHLGETPLPPYVHVPLADSERYQTVYSRQEGSAAAPTAGLHFTPDLLIALREQGVQIAHCLLHIGLDTFQPVKVRQIEEHRIHSEWAKLSADDAHIINEAKLAGGRIVAVGTTAARTLETAAVLSVGGDPGRAIELGDEYPWRPLVAFERDTNLFIYPGYRWRAVDALITNFHLPRSTLLIMISSFAGREWILESYEAAKREGYRFFSFGDAMLIL